MYFSRSVIQCPALAFSQYKLTWLQQCVHTTLRTVQSILYFCLIAYFSFTRSLQSIVPEMPPPCGKISVRQWAVLANEDILFVCSNTYHLLTIVTSER